MTRRNVLIVMSLMLVASMLLAACGGAAEPTTAPVDTAATDVAAAAADAEAAAAAAAADVEAAAAEAATKVAMEAADAEAAAAAEATKVAEEAAAVVAEEPTEEAAPASTCPEGAPSLTIWADDTRSPVLIGIKDQVQNETGVCLDVQEVGFGDIRSKISLAAPAGEGADIFVGAHDWLGELVANGVVAEIDLGDKAADFDPVAIEAFTYDGVLRGMPYAVENIAFLCNTDLVETPPATFSDLQAAAKEMQDAGTVSQYFSLMKGDPFHQESVNTAFGGYIFGTGDAGYEACDVGLDSQGAIDYLTWIDTMVKEGSLSADVDWEVAHVLFETGDAACMITGPWALERFDTAGINYSISSPPAEAQAASPFVGVQGFMVNDFSPDKVLAQSFLVDYVATNDVMEAIYLSGNRPPAYLPAQGVMDDNAKAFAEVGLAGHPMPAIPAMNAVWDAWGKAIETVFLQSATPEEAAASAAAQVREAAGCE